MKTLCAFALFALCALFLGEGVSLSKAYAAGARTLDSSCKDTRTEVLPVLAYPHKGEPVAEHKEITLQLLSLVPCSAPSKRGIEAIEVLIRDGVTKNLGVQDVVARLDTHFRSHGNTPAETRIVFALVSEFYDNLSLTLFELAPGREPVSLKLTMKRETWTDALEELRPRFENTSASFLSTFDKTEARRSVRVVFENDDSSAMASAADATLQRLRSEMAASITSRFRNPLPPKLWERRPFFKLAEEKETPDATLTVRIQLVGTRVFAQVTAKESDANARSLWLEGSLASLLVFENELFENSRDMLMALVGIYDYSITVGPEFLLDGKKTSVLPSLSLRHNRGDLAATFRIRAGRMHWGDTCGDRPLLVDFGLLPGWQFFQTERVSVDMGLEVAAGFIDIAFAKERRCVGKPLVETYISAGYGAFLQANVTTVDRLSLLGRVAAGGVSVFATGDKSDEEVRSTRNVSLFLGLGIAL
jgi:hypothetical protein